MLNKYRICSRVAVLVCLDSSKVNLFRCLVVWMLVIMLDWVGGLGSGRCFNVNMCGKKIGF